MFTDAYRMKLHSSYYVVPVTSSGYDYLQLMPIKAQPWPFTLSSLLCLHHRCSKKPISTISFLLCVPARCPDSTFTCDNGECVTKLNPECDFIPDCADGSDEARCGEWFLKLQRHCILQNRTWLLTFYSLLISFFPLSLWYTSRHGESGSGRGGRSARGAAMAGQSEAPWTAHLWSLHHQWTLAGQRSTLLWEVGSCHHFF